ncbi:hypothetical protein [Mesorhizobium argentiipisi]|uniref:Uncharacterized protein n=1 Tax=Mesorhizobium argentiipisi TaxID=3015175 RepID=A0ABU8KEG9_9HYPH
MNITVGYIPPVSLKLARARPQQLPQKPDELPEINPAIQPHPRYLDRWIAHAIFQIALLFFVRGQRPGGFGSRAFFCVCGGKVTQLEYPALQLARAYYPAKRGVPLPRGKRGPLLPN